MMNTSIRSLISLVLLSATLAACAGGPGGASSADIPAYRAPLTDEARVEFVAAKSAADSADYEEAARRYARAIALAPQNLEVHQAYKSAVRAPYFSDPERLKAVDRALEDEYRALLDQGPNPVAAYMLGELRYYPDGEESKQLFQKTVEWDPSFAPAWSYLSLIAERVSDQDEAMRMMQAAVMADPTSPEVRARLALSYRIYDWEQFRESGTAFVDEFPGTMRAAQVLYWLGVSAPTVEEKIYFHRRNLDEHPIEADAGRRNDWVRSSLQGLYLVLQKEDPEAALTHAEAAIDIPGSGRQWSEIYLRQGLLNLGRTLREAGRVEEAIPYLEEARAGGRHRLIAGITQEAGIQLALAYEEEGDTEQGRDILLEIIETSSDPDLLREYTRLATSTGWSESRILEEIWARRLADAKEAPGLGIPDLNGEIVELSDYSDKLILITFWYPACGPCRVEFPYLAETARRFSDRGLLVLAINGMPDQEDDVRPFMENARYPFIPLLAPEGWAADEYGVRGYPTNFIVDPQGRMVGVPMVANAEVQADFERWIEGYLDYLEMNGMRTAPALVPYLD